MLLKADADGPGWPDVKIAEAFNCRVQTIENARKRLVTEGFALAMDGKTRRRLASSMGRPKRKSSRCGYGRWTLRLLAEQVVELEIVESISHETVRQTLKNGMTKRKIEYWVIPPEADAEFVANMEDVLEIYAKPFDPNNRVVCMEEQPGN
ncbi:MAG: hypothetical protein C0467_10330 [Planctomycetaceae bacterium]|nr:hypothetical protein [Planctomycetaceae bacterium]